MGDDYMAGGKSQIFRFADVEIRKREFSLVKAGEVLAVEPKAFRVLLILQRNPQKLISKEELLNAVWGDAAVTENSLARSIALLRRLLGMTPTTRVTSKPWRQSATGGCVRWRWPRSLQVLRKRRANRLWNPALTRMPKAPDEYARFIAEHGHLAGDCDHALVILPSRTP
jgi:hypothetical protein